MYVACSTLCFGRHSLERALRLMAELEFSKVDVAIQPNGPHLTPADVVQDVELAAQRLRIGPGLSPAAFKLDFSVASGETFDAEFLACCRLARSSAVALVSIPAAPVGVELAAEAARLQRLVHVASAHGLVLAVETRVGTLTESPDDAVQLCERVDGLGLALDPSHYVCGPHQGKSYDQVYPYVRHVRLRDTGRGADKFQVKIGQGEIEYSRILSLLERQRYDRLLTVEIVDAPELPFQVDTEVRKLKYLLESLA